MDTSVENHKKELDDRATHTPAGALAFYMMEAVTMKEIKVVIEEALLYSVLTALGKIPSMPSPIVTDVRAFPRSPAESRSAHHGIDPLNNHMMMRVECIVPDSLMPDVVAGIQGATNTEDADYGAIVIIDVEDRIKNLRQSPPRRAEPKAEPGT